MFAEPFLRSKPQGSAQGPSDKNNNMTNTKKNTLLAVAAVLAVFGLAMAKPLAKAVLSPKTNTQPYTLEDFYAGAPGLDEKVEETFESLTPRQRLGQLVVTVAGNLGKPEAVVTKLVAAKEVGGVLLLNGDKAGLAQLALRLDSTAKANGALPLIFSADAEPSLINKKIKGTAKVKNANAIETDEDCRQTSAAIARELLEMGIRHNFAPVTDLSPGNEAIGNRSFGSDQAHVAQMNLAFIEASQSLGVVATAKHFPGHGLVKGDSHHVLPFIDGELLETPVYRPLIESGVISIMVGHIAVANNAKYGTGGKPASVSRNIVTGLLKEEMGFKGLVVTDAMNMGGVKKSGSGPLDALIAGCDLILMPDNEKALLDGALTAMENNSALEEQFYASVKKVLRLKFCLGLL